MAADGREREIEGCALALVERLCQLDLTDLADCNTAVRMIAAQLADARAQAVEALRKYVKHRSECECLLRRCDWREPVYACTCGLDALLPPRPAPRET